MHSRRWTGSVANVQTIARVDWSANAREALEFARELRDSHYDDPAERERVLAGVGRLVRWADERVR